MIDNKFFNNSTCTSNGKPKFMPPQKRTLVTNVPSNNEAPVQKEEQIREVKEVKETKFDKFGKNDRNDKFERNLSEPKLHENKKHDSHGMKGKSLFYRNSSTYLTVWGNRHLRNGLVDPMEEKDDFRLFDEHCKSMSLVEHNIENYDDLDIEIQNKYNLKQPEIVDRFDQLQLNPYLMDNIKRCKYEKLTIVQRYALPIIMNKINIMACSQTGSGKTASFLIPIIQNLLKEGPPKNEVDVDKYKAQRKVYPVVLVLAPTRELALQIYNESRKFCSRLGLISKAIYGGKNYGDQRRYLAWDGCDILIATPGRLIDSLENADIEFRSIRHVVIDEADRMLDMGFELQIKKILKEALDDNPARNDIRVAMFSATFPKEIKAFAESYLGRYIYVSIGTKGGKIGSVNKCIKQEVFDARNQSRHQLLFDLIKTLDGKILIFCNTKKCVQYTYNYLSAKNLFVTQIHGDKSQDERERELDLFKSKAGILVATDVASRGLDIPNVAFVINFELPSNIEDYIHRIGRTGRVGRQGTAISFVDDGDRAVIHKLHKLLIESKEPIPKWFEEMTESIFEERQSKFYDKYRGNGGGYGRRGPQKPFYKDSSKRIEIGSKPFGGGYPKNIANVVNDDDDYDVDGYDDYYEEYANYSS